MTANPMIRCACLTGIALSLTACHGAQTLRSEVCSDPAAAQAAFVSHVFADNASGIGRDAARVFIELPGGADPGPGFLARIRDVPVALAPASQAQVDEAAILRDPVSGGRALLIRIRQFSMTGPASAEIQGGYEEASLSASDAIYELRCERDVWTVTRRGPLKIS